MTVFREGLKTQIRVVRALMLRETKTLFGKHRLGYLWAFVQALFTISIFLGLRQLAGLHPPYGMPAPIFLIAGFVPWYLYSEPVTGGLNAIGGNRALLSYPQVFPLDLIVARTLLQGATYLCVLILLLIVFGFWGYPIQFHDPVRILLALFLALLLGFGGGTVCSSLNLMWPTTARIVPMLMRILFFTSGLFFSTSSLPLSIQKIIFFNPLAHLIELLRIGFSANYPVSFVSLPYAGFFTFVLLWVGLLLERYTRSYIDEET